MKVCACVWLVLGCLATAGRGAETVNVDAQVQKDFEKLVDGYLKLRKNMLDELPKLKPTKAAGQIEKHEHGLARGIREARRGARQGDIFTAPVAAEFRRLLKLAMQDEDAAQIRQSLQHAEPVHLKALRVNGTYPEGVPLQSTPPTLLLNLPKLPPELQYRVVGHALILLDVEANLIVDFMPNAV